MEECQEASEILQGQPERSHRVQVPQAAGEGYCVLRRGLCGVQACTEIGVRRCGHVREPLCQDLQPDTEDGATLIRRVGVSQCGQGGHDGLRHGGHDGGFGRRGWRADKHGFECFEEHCFKERCRTCAEHRSEGVVCAGPCGEGRADHHDGEGGNIKWRTA